MTILFISSLVPNSTSISLLRALKKLQEFHIQVISDVKNLEFPEAIIEKNFFDVRKYVNTSTSLILFVEGGTFQLFPMFIDKCHVKTAWYGIDTHTNFEKHVAISRVFDFSFIAQKEYVEELNSYCKSYCTWLPLAFDDTNSISKKDIDSQSQNDIAYVGSTDKSVHPIRMKLIEIINQYDLKKYIGRASIEDLYEIYKKSNCVFNYSINNDLNMRVFEAIGSGALLFTNEIRNNGLEEFFEEGSDYVLYTEETFKQDFEGLINSLNKIKCGRQERILKIKTSHTYANRIQDLVRKTMSIESKKVKSTETLDEFDYIRIAFLNASYKISLRLLLDLLIAKTHKRSLRVFRKFFI